MFVCVFVTQLFITYGVWNIKFARLEQLLVNMEMNGE